MIKIGIVDDESIFRDAAASVIRDALGPESVQADVRTFPDGESVLDDLRSKGRFDILVADIQMSGMDGMELGRRVRRMCPDTAIVFLTSYEEYAAESYRIEAYQYILKQDIQSRLPGVIRELARRCAAQAQEYRIAGSGAEKVKIFFRDIIYLYKSKGAKYVNYVTDDGIFRERNSLGAVLEELDARIFIPVERGYVVNMDRICRISGDTIYLEKGYEVQVSRARLARVKQEISRFWGGRN